MIRLNKNELMLLCVTAFFLGCWANSTLNFYADPLRGGPQINQRGRCVVCDAPVQPPNPLRHTLDRAANP